MDPAFQSHFVESDANSITDFNEFTINALDHSEVTEEVQENQDESPEICQKPTFKNTLQAKKRLHAFSSQKQFTISPTYTKNKFKTILVTEKTYNDKGELQESLVPLKKPPKRGDNPLEKAKAVVEEIELLKKLELFKTTPIEKSSLEIDEDKFNFRKSRSRSKSSERGFVFRKREKKVRNYRRNDPGRRSPSPTITTAKDKPLDKSSRYRYPKNWEEFFRDKWTFEKLSSKASNSSGKSNTLPNDIFRHITFEGPVEPIKPFYFKNEKGEEVLVPYHYLRYTTEKPKISYSVNIEHIKDQFLTRSQLLSRTNRNFKPVLEKFFNRNTRTKFRTTVPIGQRNWYSKNWKDSDSKVLETSIGLSFLQTYSDDDDEEEEQLIFESLSATKIEEPPVVDKREFVATKLRNYPTEQSNFIKIIEYERTPKKKIEKELSPEIQEKDALQHEKTDVNNTPKYSKEDNTRRKKSKSQSVNEEIEANKEVEGSWTPERILPHSNDMWDETPKAKRGKTITEERKVFTDERVTTIKKDSSYHELEAKQKAREIYSEDEWDETPEKKVDSKKEIKKKNKKRSVSTSPSPPSEKKTKKKRKLDKKKKLKEKEKKARKKEKLRAEKLKLKKEKKKKLKEKERKQEKEILKKLKKEIEHNLEEVDREEREATKKKEDDLTVKIKVEKEDEYEKVVRPPEDLRNFLDKKVGKITDLREKVEEKKKNKKTTEEIETKQVIRHTRKDSKKSIKKEIKKEKVSEDENQIDLIKDDISYEIEGDVAYKVAKHIKDDIFYKGIRNDSSYKVMKNSVKDNIPYKIVDVSNLYVEEKFPLEKEFIPDLSKMEEKMEVINVELKHSTPARKHDQKFDKKKKKQGQSNLKTNNDMGCATTPDTDEYHSNWESDEGVSPIVKMANKKPDTSWESDEEVFDRSYSSAMGKTSDRESPVLEMPLHIKNFSRRGFDHRDQKNEIRSRPRSPEFLDVDNEIKLLEAERINLSKERMQLEMEKIRIHELERKKSMEEIAYMCDEVQSPLWKKQDKRRSRWDLREDRVDSSTCKDKKENFEEKQSKAIEIVSETAKHPHPVAKSEPSSHPIIFNISSSPEITSTKSPTPTVLESAYQEFMRCVSTGEDSKEFTVISSTESEMPPDSDTKGTDSFRVQKRNRLTRSERDKNRGRIAKATSEAEWDKEIGTTDPKILQEILLPGELPIAEIPMPVPVPSPKVEVLRTLPPATAVGVLNVIPTAKEFSIEPSLPPEQTQPCQTPPKNSSSKKPFSFSTLVLPSKRSALLEKSNWKLDEDSDEDHLPAKKKYEDIKLEHEHSEKKLKEQLTGKSKLTEEVTKKEEEATHRKVDAVVTEKKEETIEKKEDDKLIDVREKERKTDEMRKKDENSSKRRHSRSPIDANREKRRKEEDSKKRDEWSKRRESDGRKEDLRRREDEAKRRERSKRASPPSRHREPSPRRRRMSSPPHKRGSPKHRSPPRRQESSRRPERGERRYSPPRRRRSHSPAKLIPRRRSPGSREKSPGRHFYQMRRSKSPGPHSPTDGLKRSVAADSTISDDLLPQPYMGESSNSPLNSTTSASSGRRSRVTLSPKRPSLDERINQVLGIEVEPPPPPGRTAWNAMESHVYPPPQQSAVYAEYQHYTHFPRHQEQYQHHQMSVVPAAPPPLPPPPPVSLPNISSKVLQVGNILQVVPTEDMCIPPSPVQPPQAQKIIQVGNIVQIVPTDIDVILPPLPPPPPPEESPPNPEEKEETIATNADKLSAEAMLVAKNAERRAERAMKRKEKEDRKKEKERRKKEKNKKKKLKLKISTEEMIKRALEMDGLISSETEDLDLSVPEIINDTPGLDPSKSILSSSVTRYVDNVPKTERRKSVQFADGIRPGEGTSPSGGEELSSPPPQTEILPKVKKYRKVEVAKKKKRKIKVKVIKKRQNVSDSDEEYENLPPPSPPPGSPPSHVFPARVKVHTINNIPQHYLPSFGVTTAPQTPTINQGMNVVYQAPPTQVYRPAPPLPPPTHLNVVGQHYPRQPMTAHMPPLPPQHMQMPISHRDHQAYGSF